MSIYPISSNEPISSRRLSSKNTKNRTFNLIEDEKDSKDEILTTSSSSLSSVNPYFILNEFDNISKEKDTLKTSGGRILKNLKQIRVNLLEGYFDEANIKGLMDNLESMSGRDFEDAEIKTLMTDILLRAEVELAKIEKSK